MRKTNERIVAFVAATAMMCSLLTGCGSRENSGDGVVSTSNTEVTTTTPVTTTEATKTEATTEPTTTEKRTEEKTTQTTEQTSTEATTKTEKKNSDTKSSTKTVQLSNSSSENNNKQSTSTVASKASTKANTTTTTTTTTPTTTTVVETTSSTEANTSTEPTTTVDTTESTSATTTEPTTTVESTSTETEPTTSTTETEATTTETETTTETTTTEPVTTNFDPRTYDWGDEKVSEFVANNTNEENLTLSLSAILKSLDNTTFYEVNNKSYTAYTVLDNCVVRSYYNNGPSTENETKIFYRYNISEESIMTDLGAINAEAAKTILRDAIANRKDTSSYGLRTERSFNICEDGNSICRNDSSISLITLDTILDNCKSDFLKTNAPELVKTDLKEIAWSNEGFYNYIARYADANGDIFATSFRELGITGASKLSDSCIRIGSSVSFGDGTVENDMIIIDNNYRGLIFLISTVDNSKDATATISVYPYTPTNYGVSIIDSMGESILVDAAAIESLTSIRFSLPYCFYIVPTSRVYDDSWNLFVESVKTPSNPVEDGNVNIDETTKDPVSEDEPKELEPVTTDEQSETTAEPEANNDSESDEEKEDVDKKVEENAELEEVIDNSTTTD